MSVHKHIGPRGVRWEVRMRGTDGRDTSKRFDTRKRAEHYEREQRTAMTHGVWTDPRGGRVTLAEWAADWQRTIVHLSGRTASIYESNLRLHVLPVLGAFELGKITTTMVRGWLSDLTRKPKMVGHGVLAPASVHQAYRTLHAVLSAAVENGCIGRNPLDGVKPPRVTQEPMRFLSHGDVARLADEIGLEHRAFVLLAAFCGLRAGEMVALRWERVHLLERRVEVVEQSDPSGKVGSVKAPKSAAGRRSIAMPRFVADALAAHGRLQVENDGVAGMGALRLVANPEYDTAAIRPLSGLVFGAPDGGPMDLHNFRSRVWARAVKRAGLDGLRIHDLRHTCASLAISTGGSVKVIQRMLGHASAAMTLDRYRHLMPSESEAVAERLDALMRQAVQITRLVGWADSFPGADSRSGLTCGAGRRVVKSGCDVARVTIFADSRRAKGGVVTIPCGAVELWSCGAVGCWEGGDEPSAAVRIWGALRYRTRERGNSNGDRERRRLSGLRSFNESSPEALCSLWTNAARGQNAGN